ncbi:MAG: hypothetical protein ALAOOOJD_00036 [bacterium]|nr:hypothetical protein [bacterium]
MGLRQTTQRDAVYLVAAVLNRAPTPTLTFTRHKIIKSAYEKEHE